MVRALLTRTIAGVFAEDALELGDEVFAELDNLGIG